MIFGLIYYMRSKNKSKHWIFLVASILFSISTFLCHSFLPNDLFWVEILAISLAHSVFIAYFICYMLNDFKFYSWLSIGICLFILGMYYIVFVNLFKVFKKDSFEEESHSN